MTAQKMSAQEIIAFMEKALSTVTDPSADMDTLLSTVMETGRFGVDAMALLDKANTQAYGNPELTKVNIGTGSRPGILISGHDLKDIEQLLEQTEGTGIDVYTHGEMLPAHYYPQNPQFLPRETVDNFTSEAGSANPFFIGIFIKNRHNVRKFPVDNFVYKQLYIDFLLTSTHYMLYNPSRSGDPPPRINSRRHAARKRRMQHDRQRYQRHGKRPLGHHPA